MESVPKGRSEHSWMQDVLAQLGLAGYNQGLDLSCIPCLSYSTQTTKNQGRLFTAISVS